MAQTAQELVAAAKVRITEIDVERGKRQLDRSLVLDVREPHEYLAGCLPGAINIPRGVLEFKIHTHPDFKERQDSEIVVYCQTGGRGALATQTLQQLGYHGAVNLAGGFKSWQESGMEVVHPAV